MPTIHLLIKGKVQGVFYRATAKEMAIKVGVGGWIKNTEEGNVEVVASGREEAINQFINWCKQGPSGAVVISIYRTNLPEKQFSDFTILRK